MTFIEAIGTVLGVLAVWLTLRQNILCWPVGLVQCVVYVWIFHHARLYSDVILQFYFILTQLYGWYFWLHGGNERRAAPVTAYSPTRMAAWCAAGLALSAAWGWSMTRWTDAAAPYPDAFILIFSILAQWLLARKVLQSWLCWIAVDIVAIGVYFYRQLYMTTGLYCIFLVLATMGFFAWKNARLAADKLPAAPETSAA